MDEPTDVDLVTDHPYEPSHWPEVCGHQYAMGWMCGYAPAEHAERLEGAAEEVVPDETP